MAIKFMVFIDGSWLYSNRRKLSETAGLPEFRLDYGKLPQVLGQVVGAQASMTDIDIVRTHLFGSHAANYDPRDDDMAQRQRDFFDVLKEEYRYEVVLYPIDFHGRRLRRVDRELDDLFEPKEKCVDIALATTMMYYAAIPYAFDVAIAVIGDRDFRPVLQHVRRLGRRVAIASIRGSCAPEYADPRDPERVKDFDIVWLNDLMSQVRLQRESRLLECEAPGHMGSRAVMTDFYPRKGQNFYCDGCREEFRQQRQEVQSEWRDMPVGFNGGDSAGSAPGTIVSGVIKDTKPDRLFGFIAGADGIDYYFHLVDLDGLVFEDAAVGTAVTFEVKRMRSPTQTAGAARRVQLVGADLDTPGAPG